MAATTEIYEARKRAGLCIACGKNPPEEGLASCRACLDAVNERRRGRRFGSVARPSAEFHLCCLACGFHRMECPTRKLKRRSTAAMKHDRSDVCASDTEESGDVVMEIPKRR